MKSSYTFFLFFVFCPIFTQAQYLDYEKLSTFDKLFRHVDFSGNVKSITADYYKVAVDSSGNVLKELTNPSVYTGNIEYTLIDSLGRVTMEATIFNEKVDEHITYFYSKNNDTIVMTIKYSSGKSIWEVIFFFSKEDLVIEAIESFYFPNLPFKRHMIYYTQDLQIDSIAVFSQDRQIKNLKYKYFERDSIVRKEYKNGIFWGDIATSILDSNGRLKLVTYAGTDFQDEHSVHYKYDRYGNIVEQLFSGGVGLAMLPFTVDENQLIECDYVYDVQGNWTVREKSVNGSLYEITERRIEYY